MSLKIKRLIWALSVSLVISVLFLLWADRENSALELNSYTVSSREIPAEFSGFRIAHISDLHNAEMGEGNENLLALIEQAEPDIIAITGDIIDFRRTDETEKALAFAENAMKIAPCYYVAGNHEAASSVYGELKSALAEAGVVILDNKGVRIEKNGEAVFLAGVDDPDFRADYLFDTSEIIMSSQLQQVLGSAYGYTILLSHRPELFDLYKEYGVNLALCGHAHGGQIRLPLVGGILAPHQGFFPEYDGGLYSEGETDMIVSRGIGNSSFPFRVNNRPEVIVIELQSE